MIAHLHKARPRADVADRRGPILQLHSHDVHASASQVYRS